MKAIVTGASSGLGKDMALYLSHLGYDLILVSRDEKKLKTLAKEVKTKCQIIALDLQLVDNCKKLYQLTKKEEVDLLINNAGFGVHGYFDETNLEKELEMIDLNIKALHVLTKLFLKDFVKKDKGYILNVASSAAFLSGPLMASYYASKSYVMRLSTALYEELKRKKSKVVISCLCPGPVETNFNKVADVDFAVKGLKSKDVAKYAIDKMFAKKLIIVPGTFMKIALFFQKILPIKIINKFTYNIQFKKFKQKKN